MARAVDLFREFADRYLAGESPDEEAFLGRAGPEAAKLAAMIAELRPGEPEADLAHLSQELARPMAPGEEGRRVLALAALATTLEKTERYEEAAEHYEEAAALFQRLGDRRGEMMSALSKGAALSRLGRHAEAAAALERSAALSEHIGAVAETAIARHRLGIAKAELGETEEALNHFKQAASIWESLGDPTAQAEATAAIAELDCPGWLRRWGRLSIREALERGLEHALSAPDLHRLALAATRSPRQASFDSLPERAQFVFEEEEGIRCVGTVSTSGRIELAFERLPLGLAGSRVFLAFPAAQRQTPRVAWAEGPFPGMVHPEEVVSASRTLVVSPGEVEYGFDEIACLMPGACLFDEDAEVAVVLAQPAASA